MKFILPLFLLFLACPFVQAQSPEYVSPLKDGNTLQNTLKLHDKEHKTTTEFGDVAYLLGYYQGIIDTDALAKTAREKYPQSDFHVILNMPDNVSPIQLAKIVDKYLNDHPEQLNEDGKVLIFVALMNAFGPKISSSPSPGK